MTHDTELVDDARLAAILDQLLPSYEDLPAAGQMGLTDKLRADAASIPELSKALQELFRTLPLEFADLDSEERDEALRAFEAAKPRTFGGVVSLAYAAYYTDQRVLSLISSKTDYDVRLPQPTGYELEPFDEAVLAEVRKMQPIWRPV